MDMIRSSDDLRNHYSEISEGCREDRQPVYITANGRGDNDLLGMSEYDHKKAELELLRTLVDVEDDVRAGRVAPVEDAFMEIRKSLLARKNEYGER